MFETIYTYRTSYLHDVNDQLNFKGQKSGTPSSGVGAYVATPGFR